MKHVLITACALGMALSSPLPLHAEEWPARPIRIVVNAAPGGVADRAMRVIAPHLHATLGQPVVVENRPGGEGYIGQQEVARAKPDGQTFLFSAGSMVVITPQLIPRSDFDPRKALTPIAPAVRIPMNLVVHPSVPVDSAAAFVKYAKENPGTLNYGSAGSGTALHLAAETFSRETGIRMNHVPYKGAGDALKDLLGGHFQVMFDPGIALPHVKAGRLKLLAVAASQRLAEFPNVPTMEEVGIKGVDGGPYFGMFAPNGLKPEIKERLNAAVAAALASPEAGKQLTTMSLEIAPRMSADAFGSYMRKESDHYARLLPELGIRGQ
ncbi:MAG: Bug family tripartite tricarboxylate transporter substrate binding protein [Burkholderiaceae bacterium]